MTVPLQPGYYWARLVSPDYGDHQERGEDWASVEWEIVELWDNNGAAGSGEEFAVAVPGIPVTQWPRNLEWGPPVSLEGRPS